mmetsp:Transcript_118459/g.377596  ORF Transcript_118459/g.377596 Transcript_118459/m.377596 type:complete len:216 (+) Transcript_118459:2378-3025(+)
MPQNRWQSTEAGICLKNSRSTSNVGLQLKYVRSMSSHIDPEMASSPTNCMYLAQAFTAICSSLRSAQPSASKSSTSFSRHGARKSWPFSSRPLTPESVTKEIGPACAPVLSILPTAPANSETRRLCHKPWSPSRTQAREGSSSAAERSKASARIAADWRCPKWCRASELSKARTCLVVAPCCGVPSSGTFEQAAPREVAGTTRKPSAARLSITRA